ncbi:MAG: DUF998 domain-containing protein [Candidatus Nanopelagicales bacterium]
MTFMTPSRWLLVALIGIVILAVSVLVGGQINAGYQQSRDYVSALSSRGATAAWVGMIGLLSFAMANAAAGMSIRAVSSVSTFAFVAAGLSGVVTAFARIQCPSGAASCSLDDGVADDLLDHIHGASVAIYQLCFLVGALAAAFSLLRLGSTLPQVFALVLIATAVASAAAITSMPDMHPGGVQRLWLAINALTVVLVCVVATILASRSGTDGTA